MFSLVLDRIHQTHSGADLGWTFSCPGGGGGGEGAPAFWADKNMSSHLNGTSWQGNKNNNNNNPKAKYLFLFVWDGHGGGGGGGGGEAHNIFTMIA